MAGKRVRIDSHQLQSFDDCDRVLKEIGEIDRELGEIESNVNAQVDLIKDKGKRQCEPLVSRKSTLELQLKEFAMANRAEFAPVKTRQLVFGSIGFRLSTKVTVKDPGSTLQALKDLGLHGCIRTREDLDKEAMKNLPTETLANVGAAISTSNTFGYEIKRVEVPA